MYKYSYLKNKRLGFFEDTLFIPDERKLKKLSSQIDFLKKYIANTGLKFIVYASLEDRMPYRDLVVLEKPIVFTSLYAFKMFIIKGSPKSFFYIERR